jgi:AmmeMemoRadiSam system protein B
MQTRELVRTPAVAGAFYPASKDALGKLVDELLHEAASRAPVASTERPCPKALIVPHAGYVYSGPVAASAFALLAAHANRITRVVLIGPAHRAFVEGMVTPGVAAMRTPLGDVAVDLDAVRALDVSASPAAHAREHSLEVELPFLQKVAPEAKLVPLAVGRASAPEVAHVLSAVWGGPETVIVISSDLSHYLPYDEGRATDERTAARILGLDGPLSGDEACGAAGINGLLRVAREKGLQVELVDLRSSGDTAGPREEVVGYGAFAFYEVKS